MSEDPWGVEAAPSAMPPRTAAFYQPFHAADVPAAALAAVRDALEPGPWAVDMPNGFWWTPGRLQHMVEIVDFDGDPWPVMRSTFRLFEQVEDLERALVYVDYLNNRALGCSVWIDVEEMVVYATSFVALERTRWWNWFIFVPQLQRLVGLLEHLAERWAPILGASVPMVAHPELGLREEPDQLVRDWLYSNFEPEAAAGLWFSDREVEASRRTWRWMLQDDGMGDAAAGIDPTFFDPDQTSGANFALDLEVPFGTGPDCTHFVAISDHPDLGRGLESTLSVPFGVGFQPWDGQPYLPPVSAMVVANTLNHMEAVRGGLMHLGGGWCAWRGQFHRPSFVPGDLVRQVQMLAGTSVGKVVTTLGSDLAGRGASTALGPDWTSEPAVEVVSGSSWPGLELDSSTEWLLVDAGPVIETLEETFPLNELGEPVRFELTDEVWATRTSALIATFGIFNPGGPSVGSLEVAIDYGRGRGVLIERLRHPWYPAFTVHAMVDQEGFARIGDLVAAVVERLEWSPFSWFEVRSRDESTVDGVYRGLELFAARQEDLTREISRLVASVSSPWSALYLEPEDYVDVAPETAAREWALTVSHPKVVDANVAHLRGAWEGAKAFRETTDAVAAQKVTNHHISEVIRRISGEADYPSDQIFDEDQR